MDQLQKAHKHSSLHKEEILKSNRCGCFYCCEIYLPTEVEQWIDCRTNPDGATALCPNCGIDSVIGDESGYPITAEFLQQMRQRWF